MNAFKTFQGVKDTHMAVERVEPYTGKPYFAFGWRGNFPNGKEKYGDLSNFAAFALLPRYKRAKYSGNWEFIRDNWNCFLDIFNVCPRVVDWAGMGQSCMEDGYVHTIDMGPDTWLAPVAMTKMASTLEDLRTADLALYIATKQAVALCCNFYKRKYDMNYCNTWDPAKHLPESGLNEWFMVSRADLKKRADIAYSWTGGVVWSTEEFNLYRDYTPNEAKCFEYGILEKYYPQWRDIYLKMPGQRMGHNGPNVFGQHFLLRMQLGENTNELEELIKDCSDERNSSRLPFHLINGADMDKLVCGMTSALIGYNAPCAPASWGEAAFLNGSWNPADKTVVLNLKNNKPFELNLMTESKPASVFVNGSVVDENLWQFDAGKRELLLLVKNSGNAVVKLYYPDWQKPSRSKLQKVACDYPETPEAFLCRSALDKNHRRQTDRQDYMVDSQMVSLDLSPQLNMGLEIAPRSGKVKPWFNTNAPKTVPGSGISRIKKGQQTFRGVSFKIPDPKDNRGCGAIGLYGSKSLCFPRKITGIKLDACASRIFFLHTAGWDDSSGKTVIRYIINYQDGGKAVVPVRSGDAIADWWNPLELPNAKLATEILSGKHKIGLYIAEWKNSYAKTPTGVIADEQKNYRMIKSIDIESEATAGSVAVIAITAEM